MTNIDAFKAKAAEAKTNRDWLSEYTAKGSSSFTALASDAYKTNKETADEVDRSTSDSGSSSGSSTIQDIATIGTLAMTVATTGLSIYQAITGKGVGGSGGGTTGGDGSGAGGGDPLAALSSATTAYQTNHSKANLKTLTQAISTATSVRNSMQEAVDKLAAEQTKYEGMLKEGQTSYELCKDHVTKLQDEMVKQNTVIDTQNKQITENEAIVQACEQGNTQKVAELAKNKQAQATQQTAVTQAEGDVKQADGTVTAQTTVQQEAQKEQDGYIADYSKAKSEESGLKSAWDLAKADLDNASDALTSAKTKINGLEAQIKTNKKNKQDVTKLEADLSTAKTDKKNAETKLSEAKKAEKTAKEAYEDNQKKQTELEGKIKVGDQTLAQIKSNLETAKKTKSDAEEKLNVAGNELRGFIDEGKIIDQAVQDSAKQLTVAKDKDTMLNTALATSIANNKSLVEQNFDANEAATTISNKVTQIKDALGNEKDASSLKGKLNQYNTAIAKAEAARDGQYTDDDLMSGGELYEKASKYGITLPEGASDIQENDNCYVVKMKNGADKYYDKNTKKEIKSPADATTTPATGNPTPAGGAGGVDTPEDKPTFTALTKKDGKPEKPAGYNGDVPEGATAYATDKNGNFIFSVNNEPVKYSKDGKKLASE